MFKKWLGTNLHSQHVRWQVKGFAFVVVQVNVFCKLNEPKGFGSILCQSFVVFFWEKCIMYMSLFDIVLWQTTLYGKSNVVSRQLGKVKQIKTIYAWTLEHKRIRLIVFSSHFVCICILFLIYYIINVWSYFTVNLFSNINCCIQTTWLR